MMIFLLVGLLVFTSIGYLYVEQEWFSRLVLALILSIGIITGIYGLIVANRGYVFGLHFYVASAPGPARFLFISVLSLAIVFFGQKYQTNE